MREGVRRILEQLRESRFAAVTGMRVTAAVPIPERLLNDLVMASLPPSAPVRDVTLRPKAGNRIAVAARLARAEFLPSLSLTVEIEQQPQLPDGPLVLRIISVPGLMTIVGAALSKTSVLPPGVRMESHRLYVDVRALLERYGWGEIVPYLESLRITTEEGRLLVDATLRV